MYTLKSKVIATGVVALTLLAAAPVFADSNSGKDNDGLHLGVFARFLQQERQEAREDDMEERTDDREDRREDRTDDREDKKEDRKHNATSTSATTTRQFTIDGTITFVSGSTLTIQGTKGAVYTVNAANASITGHEHVALNLGSLAVNDKVQVKGTLTNNVIVATKIKDKTDETGETGKPAKAMRLLSAGIVTAINGAAVTLSNFGSGGITNLTTNTATKYFVKGSATSSAALTNGSHVLVLGTTTATSTGTVNASIIVILTEGLNWLKHLLK